MITLNILKSKTRLLVMIFLLALIFNTTIRAVFFPSNKEIMYDYDMTMFFCQNVERCSYFGHLSMANTGSEAISNIAISMRKIPFNIRSSETTLNVSSAEPRTNDPVIKKSFSKSGNTTITIQDLSPGALVEIELSGKSIHKEYKEILNDKPFTIEANAKILSGSPRGTKIIRIFSYILWF